MLLEMVHDFMEGEFDLKLTVRVEVPDIAPTKEITVKIVVLMCTVQTITPAEGATFPEFNLGVPGLARFVFQEYVKWPNCKYSLEYSLTILQHDVDGTKPEFSIQDEGNMPTTPQIAFFNHTTLELDLNVEDRSWDYTSWTIFLRSNLVIP